MSDTIVNHLRTTCRLQDAPAFLVGAISRRLEDMFGHLSDDAQRSIRMDIELDKILWDQIPDEVVIKFHFKSGMAKRVYGENG